MIWLILAVFIIEVVIAYFLIRVWTYLKAEYLDRVTTHNALRNKFDLIDTNLDMINHKDGLQAPTVPNHPGGGVPAAPQPPFPPT